MHRTQKKILILGFWGVGDFIMSFPYLINLKTNQPSCETIYFTDSKEVGSLAENLNLFNHVTLSHTTKCSTLHPSIKYCLRLFFLCLDICLNRIVTRPLITIWGAQGFNIKMDLFLFLFGGKRRYCFAIKSGRLKNFSLNSAVKLPNRNMHFVNELGQLFSKVVISHEENDFNPISLNIDNILLSNYYKELKRKISSSTAIKIAIQPFGKSSFSSGRDIPISIYFNIINKLITEIPYIEIYIVGNDFYKLEREFAKIKSNNIFIVSNISLLELSDFITLMDIVFGGDSAIPHLANSLGIKSFMIHGPTAPWKTGIFENNDFIRLPLDCSPCWEIDRAISEKCIHKSCFNLLSDVLIVNKIKSLLEINESINYPS